MIVSTYNNSNCYGLAGVVAPPPRQLLLLMWIDDAWEVGPGAWHGVGLEDAAAVVVGVVQIVVEVVVVANEVAEVVLDAVEIH